MSKPENKFALIHSNIEKLLQSKAAAMPKDFNQTRFLQNAMTVLADTPGVESMTPKSVARTILKGAFLGLDFFNKECYAIPYNKNVGTKERPKWVKELQFQTDYRGEIKIVKTYSPLPIQDIFAKLVREGDVFEESIVGGTPTITFTPVPFSNEKIIGAFAVCVYQTSGKMIYETMPTAEINSVRDKFSKMATGKAWKDSWGEMAKKTVLRRLCKQIQVSFDTQDAHEAFDDGAAVDFSEYEDVTPLPIADPEPEKPKAETKPIPEQPEESDPIESELLTGVRVQITGLMSEFHDLKALETYKRILAPHKAENISKVENLDTLQVVVDELTTWLDSEKKAG